MMSVILTLLLTSPVKDKCGGLETYAWRRCQPYIIYLGPWAPQLLDYTPADMSAFPVNMLPNPPEYGAYSTEKPSCQEGP